MTSRVVAVATIARLPSGLSCRDKESPETNCTPSSVTLTLSSSTRMFFSARTEDITGDRTCNKHKMIDSFLCCYVVSGKHGGTVKRANLYSGGAHRPSLQYPTIQHSGNLGIDCFHIITHKIGHIHLKKMWAIREKHSLNRHY